MTVGDLIDLLSAYPRDLPVLAPGYEGGMEDVTHVASGMVALMPSCSRLISPDPYCGPYEMASWVEDLTGKPAVANRAVLIAGAHGKSFAEKMQEEGA